ncbi:putative hypothetical protein [Streptomyces sp. NBRC 110611]|nr:putative hypothetical protein [Streptomyces sp. NBRC 110611]
MFAINAPGDRSTRPSVWRPPHFPARTVTGVPPRRWNGMTAIPNQPAPPNEHPHDHPLMPVNEPIYAALAACWFLAGRMLPGQEDDEWTRLVDRSPWPVR